MDFQVVVVTENLEQETKVETPSSESLEANLM
jgi:hypothetical protein